MKKIRITYNSPVILTFVLLCFGVTLAGIWTDGLATRDYFSIYFTSFTDPLFYLRLFTHVFGHANMEHFLGNMMYMLLLGPMLEEKYGSSTLIKVFVLTALLTGIIHCIVQPDIALCGASGIVFACIVLASFTAFKKGEIPLSFILVVIVFVGSEVVSGLTLTDNVSNLTHVIGGSIGSVCGYMLNRKGR